MDELVNLAVDLRDERFGAEASECARREIETAGFAFDDRGGRDDEQLLAWIDEQFGGTWSTEAYAGRNVVARANGRIAGFTTYDAQGLRFGWLRGLGSESGAGIFGPIGIAEEFRGAGLGRRLLIAALSGLRACGYIRALIPAVGAQRLIAYYEHQTGARVVERFAKSHWYARKFRTIVLASGSGTNFQAVVERSQAAVLPLSIAALVCDVPDAYVLQRARAADVPAQLVVWDRASQTRANYDERLRAVVAAAKPDLILLLGWMRLLNEPFVRAWPNTINIHPAFLPLDQLREQVTMPDGSIQPAFRGPRALRDALRGEAGWAGATAHLADIEADRGAILARRPMRVAPAQTEAQLLAELHPIEQQVVSTAIMRWVYER